METKIRVAVVDDHPLFREGVVHTLSSCEDFVVVGQGASAEEAIRLVHEVQPDLLLLDMKLPGGGLEALHAIASSHTSTKIVMLTFIDDREIVASAFQNGARGYVLKGAGGDELKDTVRSVARGEAYASPQLLATLLQRFTGDRESSVSTNSAKLSDREEQVLSFLSHGLSNKEIAFRMSLSEKTVKYYITHVLRKLHVRNRVEAAIFATHRGVAPQETYGALPA